MDLKNAIYMAVETIFSKAFRTPLNSEGLEKLRSACNKLSDIIIKIADKAAIDRCQRLNEATQNGFIKAAEALQAINDEYKADIKSLEIRIKTLEEKLNENFKTDSTSNKSSN